MFSLFDKKFNAVIEGSYREYPEISHLKISNIKSKRYSTILDDKQKKFHLYAIYSSNLEIMLTNGDFKPLASKIKNVVYSHGLILNHHRRDHSVLEIPKVICFRDGRVYLEESIYEKFHENDEKLYLRPLIKASRKIFTSKKWEEYFKKSLDNHIE